MYYCKVKNKIPFEKDWNKHGYTRNQLKIWEQNGGEIGWIVQPGYIVVDIDNPEDAERVMRLDLNCDLNCGINKTKRGLHLIFKTPDFYMTGASKRLCALGILVDYRVQEKNQIVWPTQVNSAHRKIIKPVTSHTDMLPEFFYPVNSNNRAFINMPSISEGGRNDALTRHYGLLIMQDILEDPRQVLEQLNSILDNPLPDEELNTIMNSIDGREQRNPTKSTNKVQWWATVGINKDGSPKRKFLAHKLADKLQNDGIYKLVNGQWYLYSMGIWLTVDKLYMERVVDAHLKNEGSSNQLKETISLLQVRVFEENQFNKDDNIAVFENGTWELGKGLREHKRADNHLFNIDAKFNTSATCPTWLNFVSTCDKEDIQLLQEMFGYFLITNRSGKSFFIISGPTDCGKSVVADLLTRLFNHNVSNTSIQAICDPANRWAVGELYGTPLNINTDLSSGHLKDTSVLKQLTGDGVIRYEMKGKDPFTAMVTTKMLFMCNALPANKDVNGAFYNRCKLMHFSTTIDKKDQDKHLIDKLYQERDGIVQWSIKGLERLYSNNWEFSQDQDKLQKYKEASNSALCFAYEEYTKSEESLIPVSDLYDSYKAWCTDQGVHPYAKNKFTNIISTEIPGVERHRTSKARFVKGLTKIT